MGDHGTVTISLDFELAWGLLDDPSLAETLLSENRRAENAYLRRFLEQCDRLNIPITFATVGHLFLDSCDGSHDTHLKSGDHGSDPGTDIATDPLFYAPDLIDRIRGAETAHEIATHTFSHVLCDTVPRATVDRELKAAAEIHEANGLEPPRSFVAPRNRLPDYDVLNANGIDVVRTPHRPPASTDPEKYVSRIRNWVFEDAPAVSQPRRTNGVIETRSTSFPSLTATHLPNGRQDPLLPFRTIPRDVRQRYHEAYLERSLEIAIEEGLSLHLWSHLYNLSNEDQWKPISSFLDTVAQYRDEGLVRVETMDDLATKPLPRSTH